MSAIPAWRNLLRNRKRTAITVASVALGLLFAVVYASFEEGLRHRLENEFVRFLAPGHITLEHPAYQDDWDVGYYLEDAGSLIDSLHRLSGVEDVKTVVIARGLVKSAQDSGFIEIRGVEPSVERRTSPMAELIVTGRYLEDGDGPLIVLGERLARNLRVAPGNRVVLSMADADGLLTEVLCRVAGTFETGMPQIDSRFAHVPAAFLREALEMPPDSATQIGVLVKNTRDQGRLLRRIGAAAGGRTMAVHPWQAVLPEMDAITRLIRISVWILEGVLLVLILFTVWNTMLMSILERRGEFAVQLALGTPAGYLKRQLFFETAWIAVSGVILGGVAGAWLSRHYQARGADFGRFFGEHAPYLGVGIPSTLHARLTAASLLIPALVILAGVLCLGIFLMRRAVQTPIAESLRGGKI